MTEPIAPPSIDERHAVWSAVTVGALIFVLYALSASAGICATVLSKPPGAVFLQFLAVAVLWGYPFFCFNRIAENSKTADGWLAWVPVARWYLFCKMARTSYWWLCLTPLAGVMLLVPHRPEAPGWLSSGIWQILCQSTWWTLAAVALAVAVFMLVVLSRIPRCVGAGSSRFLILVPIVNLIYLGRLALPRVQPTSHYAK